MASSSLTPAFDAELAKAVDDGIIGGAVLLAGDTTGNLNYARAIGKATLDPSATANTDMQLDSILALASMTKLLTSVAVLQLVERGVLRLDTDVAPYLPGLAAQPILTGFSEGGAPQYTARTKPILVRHLLTHSSGCGYGFADARLGKWLEQQGLGGPGAASSPVYGSVAERYAWPLLFEPGTAWGYGCSSDWAGALVEAAGGATLDAHLQAHVLAPLGIAPGAGVITFFPERRGEGVLARVADMTVRDGAAGRVGHGGAVFPRPTALPADRSAYGGEGGYADLSAYAKVLRSLLVDDGKLLAPATAELLFKPLLDPAARAWLNEKTLVHPEWIVGTVPHGVEYDYGAGGLLLDDDGTAENHQHRKRGFLKWGGAWNLFWFIDRAAGAFGVFGSQVLPPADPVVRPLIQAFEEALYSKL